MGVHPDAHETRAFQTRVCELNDAFRTSLSGGRVLITNGVAALGAGAVGDIMLAVQKFCSFTPDNDPHGEHDFGSFKWDNQRILWKIDYYDASLEYGSPNPADPAVTTRVLTIMLASEY